MENTIAQIYSNMLAKAEISRILGVTKAEFTGLVGLYSEAYEAHYGQSYSTYKSHTHRRDLIFNSYEEMLFLYFYIFKTGLPYELLSVTFGVSISALRYNFEQIQTLLLKGLRKLGHVPVSDFKDMQRLLSFFNKQTSLRIDVTEYCVERPEDTDNQKDRYSGKKKRHTLKHTLISNEKKEILFIGQLYGGCHHDFDLLKEEIKVANHKIKPTIYVDLGYLGIVDLFSKTEIKIPFKKPKKSKNNPKPSLTEEQKSYNKTLAKERISVEHCIAGIKRFYLLHNKIRLKDKQFIHQLILMSSAIWNFRIKMNKNTTT